MTSGQRWTLTATILGSGMAFIDATVVNVALPALQTDLRATITDTTGRPHNLVDVGRPIEELI